MIRRAPKMFCLPLLASLAAVTIAALGRPAAGTRAVALEQVVIQPGDTLWEIAVERFPDQDPRKVVWEIRKLNGGLDPGALRPGQIILVPVGAGR